MARLFSSGFELGDADTSAMEWSTTTSGQTADTSIVRSGTYSLGIPGSAGTSSLYAQFQSANANGPFYFRFYIRVTTAPDVNNVIASVNNNGTTKRVLLFLKTDRTLELQDDATNVIGSASSALDTDKWYRVEIAADASGAAGADVLRWYIDGVLQGETTTHTFASGFARFYIGGALSSEALTSGQWYFDDVAINDSTGSFQTGLPGAGSIVHLRPDGEGDNDDWDGVDGFENVDEVTPNDATDFIEANNIDLIQEDTLAASPAAIETNATIKVVSVGVRYSGENASDNSSFVLRVKAAPAGTVEESSAITPANTTWQTNDATLSNQTLTIYDLPGGSTTAWTKADLDAAQIGVRISTERSGNAQITAYWLAVEYLNPVIEQEGFAFGTDDNNEASHTLGTQDANFTGVLGVKTLRLILNATGDPTARAFKLKYKKNGGSGYTTVPIPETGAIEAGDMTESGSNTADASWPVSYPNASTGDLLIFNIGWDDSTTVDALTVPAGPNGETAVVVEDVTASGSTAVRGKVVHYVATGTWTASTLAFTPSDSEQWTAVVIRVPTGEFDGTTPIGTDNSNPSTGTTDPYATAAITAGSSDGGGRVVTFFVVDLDPLTGSMTGWTERLNRDRGQVAINIQTRDALATNGEVIGESTGLTTATGRNWVSFTYIVRPPLTDTDELYISRSANVTASGENTTARLTAPSGKSGSDFTTGRRWDDENGTDTLDLGADDYTEVEWILTAQSPATTDDYFEFQVYEGDARIDTYTVTPKWTIGTEEEPETAVKDIIGGGIIVFAR